MISQFCFSKRFDLCFVSLYNLLKLGTSIKSNMHVIRILTRKMYKSSPFFLFKLEMASVQTKSQNVVEN